MQHVTEQHCVEAVVLYRKVAAVIGQIIDACGGAFSDVQSDDGGSQHSAEMMRDKTVAATNVEHVGARRQCARHFQRHIVGAAHLAAPSHALETALDQCE